MTPSEFISLLPAHKASLSITHNPHKDYYESVADYVSSDEYGYSFKDEASRARCIETGELWEMHWYPDTPVGWCGRAAPTLEGLFDFEV